MRSAPMLHTGTVYFFGRVAVKTELKTSNVLVRGALSADIKEFSEVFRHRQARWRRAVLKRSSRILRLKQKLVHEDSTPSPGPGWLQSCFSRLPALRLPWTLLSLRPTGHVYWLLLWLIRGYLVDLACSCWYFFQHLVFCGAAVP